MNIENTRSHFGFIGFGLIGGSIAHALRELYPSSHIMAYNYYIEKPHPMLELAKKDGDFIINLYRSVCFFRM